MSKNKKNSKHTDPVDKSAKAEGKPTVGGNGSEPLVITTTGGAKPMEKTDKAGGKPSKTEGKPTVGGNESEPLVIAGTGSIDPVEKPAKSEAEPDMDEDGPDLSLFTDADGTDPDHIGFSPSSEGLNLPIRDSDGPLAFEELVKKRSGDEPEEQIVVKTRVRRRAEGGASLRSLAISVAYLAAVLLLGVWLGIFIVGIGNDVFAFTFEEDSQGNPIIYSVTITDEGMAPAEVGRLLKEAGVIKYDWAFKLYAQLKKKDSFSVKAGSYTISAAANYDAIMSILNPTPVRGEIDITFSEGMNTDDIIDLFLANGIGTREGFEYALNSYPYEYWFMKDLKEVPEGRYYRLDGYLYPDTYRFYTDSSEVAAIDKMLSNFNQKFGEGYKQVCDELGMSVDEVVRIASMIESEAKRVSDYSTVSAVFYNRLNSASFEGSLQSDATVQYYFRHVEGARHTEVTPEDLLVDTPYNTYLYKGLPPGAICNPSLNALKAALYPDEDCPYYYFVSRSNGYMYYAKTLSEHNANIAKVKEENEDPEGSVGEWE